MKICTKCKINKELNEYYKQEFGKYGVRSKCKECVFKHNKENCRAIYFKEYKVKNHKKISDYGKKYYQKNKEKNSIYYQKNKDRLKENARQYRIKNKDKRTKYNREKLNNDINYKLVKNLRTRLNCAMKNNQKTGSAIKDLGCSIDELKKQFENQFQKGMTWDNYGEWHIDHIKPLSSFNLSNNIEFKKACHHTNLQPLWATDNLIKGAKI